MAKAISTTPSSRASWRGMRNRFLIGVAVSFVLLQVLFLGNMCYLYATQFRNGHRAHALKILYVDYDGGIIGQSVRDAYEAMRGATFHITHAGTGIARRLTVPAGPTRLVASWCTNA